MTWRNDSEKFPLLFFPRRRGNENFDINEEGSVEKNTAFAHSINYAIWKLCNGAYFTATSVVLSQTP